MFDADIALLVAAPALLFGLLAGVGAASLIKRLAAERERYTELQRQFELMRQSISGLTAGAIGLDRRVQRLEASEKTLAERQDTFELQQTDEQPYSQAIRLVQQGVGANRLIQELDLSESEADLIVRLHGQRRSA